MLEIRLTNEEAVAYLKQQRANETVSKKEEFKPFPEIVEKVLRDFHTLLWDKIRTYQSDSSNADSPEPESIVAARADYKKLDEYMYKNGILPF